MKARMSSVMSSSFSHCSLYKVTGKRLPLPSKEPSVPGQESVRGDDTGDFGQEFPAKLLTLYAS